MNVGASPFATSKGVIVVVTNVRKTQWIPPDHYGMTSGINVRHFEGFLRGLWIQVCELEELSIEP